MDIPKKCTEVLAVFLDGSEKKFSSTSEIEEYEDCYEFNTKEKELSVMVCIQKSEVRYVCFVG